MFDFSHQSPRKKPSLTPMIDVVFLLLVFFMLVARFGLEFQIPIASANTGISIDLAGPPKLVELRNGQLFLNGLKTNNERILKDLNPLMKNGDDLVIIKPTGTTTTQEMIDIIIHLNQNGIKQTTILGGLYTNAF